MARRVLMAEVRGGLVRVDRCLNGRCECDLYQWRDDGEGCATMREKWEGVEISGANVDD